MKKVAIIIPAYNEELTIKAVILDFFEYCKESTDFNYKIYIIDNNSKDATNSIARQVISEFQINAEILFVKRQGKSNAVREAFRYIDADAYIMIDADSTYWAEDLDKFIYPVLNDSIDMVIGDRISTGIYHQENTRSFHGFGNSLVKNLINLIFNAKLKDIMTGYRAFSKRFVKNYPILCEGFELETDMSIFCLEHKFNIIEVPIKFTDRPQGSFSKLNTFSDGFKVIMTIFALFKNYKPMQFFGLIGFLLLVLSVIAGVFPVIEYIEMKFVYKVPMAILAVGLAISSLLMFGIALILGSIRKYQNMNFELNILNKS
ncbi:MAG: glycosyltransferase family 2 protein [Burkholderiales bacterium]